MTKIRVYELAKELNTTSKRLMEKLAEIKIVVKNHMSLLEENELEALYDHIGIIRHSDDKKIENEEKRNISPLHYGNEQVKDIKKETKSGPRIIRTTEINLDAKGELKDTKADNYKKFGKGNDRDTTNHKKNEFVKVASSTSGLRPGFVRETRPEIKKNFGNEKRNDELKVNNSHEIKKEAKNLKEQEDNMAKISGDTVKPASAEANVKVEVKHNNNKDAFGADVKKVASTEQTKLEEFKNIEQKSEEIKKEEVMNEEKKSAEPIKEDINKKEAIIEDVKKEEPKKEEIKKDNTSKEEVKRDPVRNDRFDNRNSQSFNNNNRQVNRNTPGRNNTNFNDNRKDTRPGDAQRRPYPNNRNDNMRPQQGGAPANRQGNRPAGDRGRDFNRTANKPLEIPKVDAAIAKKDENVTQRSEVRREFFNKDVDKDSKREQKRDVPVKGTAVVKNKKPVPNKNVFSDKKDVSKLLSDDFILDEFYNDDVKKSKKAANRRKETKVEEKYIPPKAVLTSIKIPESITVKDLAESLKKTAAEVIKKLMALGIMAVLNQELDFDTAAIIADEFNVKAEKEVVVNEEDILFDDSDEEDKSKLVPRPPVVVVMGHVDHGKTSLLDAIKQTNVIDSEAGGITQHIGAYMVKVNNRNITFLDTPGHEAFTAMRARGAQVTDIAILVVAADDGVMPQTVEAINHAKAANVTIIVAINKIDKPGANSERVKQELTEHGLVVEEWGGDTICVEVSAKKRTNIDQLLEMVLLAADMLELSANPDKQAKGTVIEAKLDKDKGPIATVLVQRGTLNVGDSIVTGSIVGRIRAMTDDKRHKIKKAGPSTPVEILGMPEVPEAGEIFYAITDEKVAKQLVDKRKQKHREQHLKNTARVSLDDLFNQIKEGHVKDLNIIVKADVQGSVEAVKQSLDKLSNEEVRVKIIHGGVGAVTESDVTLAQVSNAIIIGFNVRPSANVVEAAKNAGVDLRLYRIIYNAIEDIQAAMKGMLDPTYKENVLGHIEVRQIFKVSGIGTIGGGYVTDGKVVRNSEIRIVRDGIVIHEGKLASLKRFKDDVKEVSQGFECGMSIEKFNDIKVGDVIEAFVMEEVAR
ncbi:MAG: translation initiation factor IF-2 [Clostridiaceae bacterium]|nr:translation initiation factor IF-2 [Clostridiaceae bacterium]